jgi:hypothetical protein
MRSMIVAFTRAMSFSTRPSSGASEGVFTEMSETGVWVIWSHKLNVASLDIACW